MAIASLPAGWLLAPLLHWRCSWGRLAVVVSVWHSLGAFLAARIELDSAKLSLWASAFGVLCRLPVRVGGRLDELRAAAKEWSTLERMSLVGAAVTTVLGAAPVDGLEGDAASTRLMVVLSVATEELDEYLPLVPISELGGWWIAYTTGEEPPHEFEYVAFRLGVAPLPLGCFRIIGRSSSRRAPPGVTYDVNWVCAPPHYEKWMHTETELATLVADAHLFTATVAQGGGLAASELRRVALRAGVSAMPEGEAVGSLPSAPPATVPTPTPASVTPIPSAHEAAAGLGCGFGPDSVAARPSFKKGFS